MKKIIFALLCATLILAAYPVVRTAIEVGSAWRGVIPSVVDDDLYYYARLQSVAKGDIQIGNPYFMEHRSEIAVAFFASDWLAAAPLVLLHSLPATIVIDLLLWSVVFVLLTLALFRRMGVSPRLSALAAFGLYLQSYYFFVRPVSLQMILPFLILFWLALWMWMEEQSKRERNGRWIIDALLIAGIVLPFYVYTYLWQITVVTMLLVYGFFVRAKAWAIVRRLTIVGAISVIGIVPMLWYLFRQLGHPAYWETVRRIGLVQTHVPTSYAMLMAALTVMVVGIWMVATRWKLIDVSRERTQRIFGGVIATGASFAIVLVSNVLTGKELEIGNHVARFLFPWFGVTAVLFANEVFGSSAWKETARRKIFAGALAMIASIPALMGFQNLQFLGTMVTPAMRDIQKDAGVLQWLDRSSSTSEVVLAPDDLSAYIPMQTKDFVLFQSNGGLHLMYSEEVQERFSASHFMEDLTAEDLAQRYRSFAGVGPSTHEWLTYNREVLICRVLHLNALGKTCGSPMSGVLEWRGKAFFDHIASDAKIIREHIGVYLKKYHVQKIVVETSQALSPEQQSALGVTEAYRDDSFIGYQLQAQ